MPAQFRPFMSAVLLFIEGTLACPNLGAQTCSRGTAEKSLPYAISTPKTASGLI